MANKYPSWRYSSGADYSARMCEILGSVPAPRKTKHTHTHNLDNILKPIYGLYHFFPEPSHRPLPTKGQFYNFKYIGTQLDTVRLYFILPVSNKTPKFCLILKHGKYNC